MGQIRGWFFVMVFVLAFSVPDIAQKVDSDAQASDSKAFCPTDRPLYRDRAGKPIWLDTELLLKAATRCRAPQMPAMFRMAELDGFVSVDILVNDKGRVWCAKVISGSPLLTTSAINALKDWRFEPKKKNGKAVWFYGHLRFHFSTREVNKNENPCTVAHW
jgi:TonB family protein